MIRRYFIAGFTWDGESQKDRFINEGIWENGYDDKYQDVYNNIRIGDYIALKSTFVQGRKSVLRIHKVGTIRAVSSETMRVNVDWFNDIMTKDITDITWYSQTLCEITNEDHIYKIFDMNENKEKVQQIEGILEANFNLILTGAPGTGKTYLAKQIAEQMIFGEVKNHMTDEEKMQFDEQCGFVQFHPSYDYTDFVEGLRPKQDDYGNIGFERKDGIFKEFCLKALSSSAQHESNDIEKSFDESWQKMLDYVREGIAKGELIKIGIWEYGLSSADSLKYSSLDTPSKYTFTITKKNVYDAYRGLKARPSGYFQKYIVDVVKFMQDKFGLKPYKKSEDAKKEKENSPYVFIIDEINRGEISKIFGELFFSIDPGYRGVKGKVKTQYQNLVEEDDEYYDGFYVPENVYIIGTMNDIDRSVESMDFAFRRRFAFKEITAKDSQKMLDSDEAWGKDNNGVSRKPNEEELKIIKEKMEALNNLICPEKKNGGSEAGIDGLSSAYHIGASYFLKLVNYKKDDGTYDYDQLWDNHLEGLLLEYMRGMTDVSEKIKTLAIAFGYSKMEKYE